MKSLKALIESHSKQKKSIEIRNTVVDYYMSLQFHNFSILKLFIEADPNFTYIFNHSRYIHFPCAQRRS
ncbi:hypothetical protein ACHQM5_028113 [Ranunculus cassubicifolius]